MQPRNKSSKSIPARIRVAQALKVSGPEDRSQQGKPHDEEGLKKFQNSIALAKLDAMGDLVITMIEDVREAMKNADPAQGLQGLEKTFKNILTAIKEHASSLKGKAESEQRQMAASTTRIAISLSDADKKVIDAFTDEASMESKKLRSDGKKLDGLWMGGSNIAEWVDGKIRFNDLGSKAAQQVQQVIRRMAPKNDLEETGKTAKPVLDAQAKRRAAFLARLKK